MKKTKTNIIHHAKRLIHHSSRIAHKHKHILLSYMHVCLIIVSLGIYHMATSMYAQENGETVIVEQSIEITTAFEETSEETTSEETTSEEISEETNTNEEINSEITESNTGVITDNEEILTTTGDITLITGDIITTTGDIIPTTGEVISTNGEIIPITGEVISTTGDIIPTTGEVVTETQTSENIFSTGENITGILIENPNDLPGLLVWLDANQFSSLSFTGNNLVTEWKDKRGFAKKAFMEEENKCPVYVTDVVNNHPALFFDNKDDGMETNVNLTQPYTMFLLYNKEITTTDYARAIQGLDNRFIGFNNSNFIYYASGQINKLYPRTNNNFKVVTITSDETQTQVFINNENISEYPEFTKDPLKLSLGAIGENQEPLGGYIAEIAIYDHLLSGDEINQINTYFIKKYYPFTSIGLPFSPIQNESPIESTGSIEITSPKEEPMNQSGINEIQTNEVPSEQQQTIEQKQKSELNINEISTTNETATIQESIEVQEIVSAISGEPTIENITNTGTAYESGTEEQTIAKEYRPENYFDNAYKVGEYDEKIIILQQLLTKLGLFSGSRGEIYDITTLNAVYLFQKEEGLLVGNEHNQKVRGYMGPGTRAKLNKYLQQYSKQELENIQSSENEINQELLDESGIFSTLFLFDPITNPNFTNLFGSGNQTGTIAMTFDTIDEENIKQYLLSKGFSSENISLTKVPNEVLIGKQNIDLSNKNGHLLIPIIFQSTTSLSGNIAEVEIPEGTIFTNQEGEAFTGIIEAPTFYTESEPETPGIEIISSIKVGADEHIQLEDGSGNKINATFRVPVPGLQAGDTIVIDYSQDGESRYHLDNIEVSMIENEPYAIFQANHFTIFSFGIWTGSFSINNDTAVTTGLNVTLNSIATGATHMRFGNTIAERDAATWTGYKTGVNWTISSISGDGIKRVYAQFSGNGTIRNVADSIIYDTTDITQSSGLQLHLDGSYAGNIFYDLGPKNYTASGISGVINTTRSGEKTIGFSGTNYVNIATGIITAYPFTISARVKPDRVTGTQGIAFRGTSTANNIYYGINLNATTFQITARNGTTARTANGTVAAQAGKRYHVVGVFTSSASRRIYVNGVQGGTSSNTVALGATSPHRTVGKYAGTTANNLSGMVDEVRVYNKALSAGEIQSLYLVPPTFDPIITASSTPILYGELPSKIFNISLIISGTTYFTTGTSGNKWMTLPILTGLAAGTYNVTVNYTNIYGKTGSFISTGGLIINTPSNTGLHIDYTTTGWTSGNVISILTGLDPTYMIINNQGSESYTFTGNGNFTYQYVDKVGTTGTITANVNNIDKTFPTFSGITSGAIYSGAVNINFADANLSGAILSGINGTNYYSGNFQSGSFTTEGTFILKVLDFAGNTTGAIFSIQYTPEQRSTNTLTTIGYQTGTTTLTSLDPNTLIGNTNINFAGLSGNLLVPTLLQSSNTYVGQAGEVEIPAGAVLQNAGGTPFIGTLEVPTFQDPASYSSYIGKTALSAVDVGNTTHIYFKDTGNNDMQVTFRMPVPGKNVGDLIDIYTAEDGINFTYLTTVHVQNIGGNPYVVFESNHFSVVVTAGNNGTSISADKAANSTSGAAYTTLGNIVIAEGANTDFAASQTNATVILTAPTNRRFKAGSGTITYTAARDITAASIAVTASTITATFTTDSAANRRDTLTISGIQVQAITGNILPSAGNILRTSGNPGTASIIGITNDVTNFGSLSQTFGSHKYLVITLPGQTFVAGSGNSGFALTQKANSGFVIPRITATDQFYNIVTSYAGTKTLSYTGAGGTPNYTTGVSFTAGQSTTTLNTILTEAKTGITLSVSDGTISGPISSPFTVYATPTASVIYTPGSGTITTGNVIATLTGFNKTGIVVTNNSGSTSYTFTSSGTFTFNLLDLEGYTGDVIASVNWIKNRLSYSTTGFSENSLLNNGSISGNIIVTLGTGSFSGAVANYVTFTNVPAGLTGTVILSGTNQVILGLTGNATNHSAANSITNLSISFATGAFSGRNPSDVIDSTKTGLSVTFLDPYVGLQLYPTADTMLDADTNPADGCADGVCQENNYGATDYLCTSDFGSKILLKYDLSSVPVGSVITSAKIRLTKFYIGALTPGTGFKMKQMINNAGWIEGTQNNAKALSGEPNYKMRKRTQETWYNGNIGLVAGIDYKSADLITNPLFTGSLTANVTQEFNLNSNGIATLQDWHDDSSTNQGFVISDADLDWLCIYSKENATITNRPLLTINYAPNTSIPLITNFNPANNESGVSLSNNLIITFDEKIKAYTGFTISIKRLSNNSIFETIGATSGNVTISNNIVTINPTNNFENFTGYYVEIQSGAFRDYAGNVFTGFAGSGTWKFTTINTASVPTVTGNIANNITDSSATFYGTLLTTGSSAIIERGFYRSTTNGFNDGVGTKVSESGSWTTTGSFSGNITGLPAGTMIYFKAFARNNEGAGYTTQSGFITKPGQPILLAASNIDNDAFKINWISTTGTSTYKLYVTTNSGWTTTLTGYNPKLLSGTLTSRTLTGLTRETTYYYKLIATNIAGDSIESTVGTATTLLLPAPTAWLKFEETAGNTAYDSTPNNNNGVIYGGTILNQSGADGKSFRFNGSTSDVSILDFNYGPSFTVSFWFKTPSTGDNIHLYSHGDDSAANSINVLLNYSDQTLRTYINGNQTILNLNSSTYATMTNNQWHYYVVTVEDNGIVPGKKNVIVYIDGVEKATNASVNAGSFDPINNITIGRRSTNQTGTYYSGRIDDVRIYDKRILSRDVNRIFTDIGSNIDTTAPTATISYNPGSGTCYSGNVIATLTGYSEAINITNNSGSNQYTFTTNGSFIFEFQDAVGNTGSTTANVTWICKDPLSIGGPTMITTGIEVSDSLQMVEQRFPDYFRINDPIGADSGYYTTIGVTNLSGAYSSISNSNIEFKANSLTTIEGTVNPRVTFGSGLLNYQPLSSPLTYIKRDPAANSYTKGKYGDTPRLEIHIDAYQQIDNYHATINYTLYEN